MKNIGKIWHTGSAFNNEYRHWWPANGKSFCGLAELSARPDSNNPDCPICREWRILPQKGSTPRVIGAESDSLRPVQEWVVRSRLRGLRFSFRDWREGQPFMPLLRS
jgi:hypothetical protein